jgi:hypothetical protein
MSQNRQREDVPLLAPDRNRRIHDITKHVACHRLPPAIAETLVLETGDYSYSKKPVSTNLVRG